MQFSPKIPSLRFSTRPCGKQMTGFDSRKKLLKKIGKARQSTALLYCTSDRIGAEAQIAPDVYDYFVHHLDKIWPSKKISLILHTNGGNTSAAWRIVNLLRTFCDDLEVIVPSRAFSAGTLISLGANRIIMTKQASLGPIDPSLSGPLSPQVPGQPNARVPVSVEVVQGYLDLAMNEMAIEDQSARAGLLKDLADKVHPLVLGQIFRSRTQIRSLAETLLHYQDVDKDKKIGIVNFLCGDSGSHDRAINQREAKAMGLVVEKPSSHLYTLLKELYEDYVATMQLRDRFDVNLLIAGQTDVTFSNERILLESVVGGSCRYVTDGTVKAIMVPQPGTQQQLAGAEMTITYEGWRVS